MTDGTFAGRANPMREAGSYEEVEARSGIRLPRFVGKKVKKYFYYDFHGKSAATGGVQINFEDGDEYRIFRGDLRDASGIYGGKKVGSGVYMGVKIELFVYGDIRYSLFNVGSLSCSYVADKNSRTAPLPASRRIIWRLKTR